LMIVLFV